METSGKVLMIDDEPGMCAMVESVLADCGFTVKGYTDANIALDDFVAGRYHAVVTDMKMPGIDGLEVLERVRAVDPEIPVIVITAHATVDNSIQALRKGAFDMLTKPFEPDELLHRVNNAVRQRKLANENEKLKALVARGEAANGLVGESEKLRLVVERAHKLAGRDFPVLITGESGTGKELFARLIHDGSVRRDKPFVAINCGALPKTLLESELFGARKGSFTGANEERTGLVQAADGGTLFLDEVGNLPEHVQKVLLRFLQEKEFYRVGDTNPTRVDVRVVGATNADLKAEVKIGDFREDLYYRLAVARLELPPLRERKEDLPLLSGHFISEQNKRFDTDVKGLTVDALAVMNGYQWPGNVRQLKNVIEAAMALETTGRITPKSLMPFIDATGQEAVGEPDWAATLERFETQYFGGLLEEHDGNVELAAESAGVNQATLYRKIKKYNLKQK